MDTGELGAIDLKLLPESTLKRYRFFQGHPVYRYANDALKGDNMGIVKVREK